MSENTIKVWDPLVRIFHWSLVISFVIAYFTGDEENNLHIVSGYVVLGLVVFRIIWGFVGSKYARFNNFIYSPTKVISYLKGLALREPEHYMGHNPAGGYMIALLLVMLLVSTITGLKVYGLEGHGPLAGNTDIVLISEAAADEDKQQRGQHEDENEAAEELWEEVHELASNFTVFLIFLHIFAVAVSSRLHKENLVKAMVTGKKNLQDR